MNHRQHHPRLLFLNPPSSKLVIRDYYCSKSSRSNYIYPPVDFIMQSGILASGYSLYFIDAVRDGLSEAETIEAVEKIDPHVVFFIAGAVNYPDDLEFVSKLHTPQRIFIGTGDIFFSEPKSWLEKFPFIHAVALDFTNNDVLYFLQGKYDLIQRMAYRTNASSIIEAKKEDSPKVIDIPIPRHEMFLHSGYRFPFSKHRQFSVILTDFGCPFRCGFCVMASLPYRYRMADSVLDELNALYHLGVRELFWFNQTFGVRKKQTIEILKEMSGFSPLFSWTAFCRPDILDELLIQEMKKAGCHTIILGVESASEETLKRYKKDYSLEQVKTAFRLCRKHKIKTVGTFILGLPGESEKMIKKTLAFSRSLGCDFASFHVAVPRAATELRKKAICSGKIDPEAHQMDQSGDYIGLIPGGLNQSILVKLKRKAVLGFYLRPRYLFRRLLTLKSLYEGMNMAYQAFYLIVGALFTGATRKKK